MIIRAGFETQCWPAGSAQCSVTGDMCREDAQDVIYLLELTIGSIRRQIAVNRVKCDAEAEKRVDDLLTAHGPDTPAAYAALAPVIVAAVREAGT